MQRSTSITVDTASGRVQGRQTPAGASFLGIPYAAPTGGARRFGPPEPVTWSGVLNATATGPACPQMADWFSEPLRDLQPEPADEACCVLNVWTPAADSERRPVLVWLHGGLFAVGSGSWPLYGGDRLAEAGEVVVVTVNHRLDVLGLLWPGPDLDHRGEVVANAGMLDLVAALRWVRDHVAAFGGDPGSVTVFGQSGGAGKASVLVAMPAAAGLFHRVVLQSGARLRVQDPADAERAAASLLAETALSGNGTSSGVERLRRLPASAVVAAAGRVARRAGIRRGGAFAPVVDGTVLPRHPVDALAGGAANGLDLLIGTTGDEATILHLMDGVRSADRPPSDEAVRVRLDELRIPPALWTAYGDLLAAPPHQRLTALETYQWRRHDAGRFAAAAVAGGATVHTYRFDEPVGALGATHGAELPFVFRLPGSGTVARFRWEALISAVGDSDAERRLADVVSGSWTSFARQGLPGAPTLPRWPAHDAAAARTMRIAAGGGDMLTDPDEPEREMWERHAPGVLHP